jgi:hypothetical protein
VQTLVIVGIKCEMMRFFSAWWRWIIWFMRHDKLKLQFFSWFECKLKGKLGKLKSFLFNWIFQCNVF